MRYGMARQFRYRVLSFGSGLFRRNLYLLRGHHLTLRLIDPNKDNSMIASHRRRISIEGACL